MHQEIAFLGLYIPALFFCAIAASVVWFVIDGVMLRLAAWGLFFHPPLARLALYFILFSLVAAFAPDF